MQYRQVLGVLINARRKCGFSRSEFARLLGRPDYFVSQYEHGIRRLDVIEFVDVAEALGLDPVDELRRVFFPAEPVGGSSDVQRNVASRG